MGSLTPFIPAAPGPAGKSTLTLALFRIIEPPRGAILLDGVDLTDVGVADVREALAIIPQVRGARALHAPALYGVSER